MIYIYFVRFSEQCVRFHRKRGVFSRSVGRFCSHYLTVFDLVEDALSAGIRAEGAEYPEIGMQNDHDWLVYWSAVVSRAVSTASASSVWSTCC